MRLVYFVEVTRYLPTGKPFEVEEAGVVEPPRWAQRRTSDGKGSSKGVGGPRIGSHSSWGLQRHLRNELLRRTSPSSRRFLGRDPRESGQGVIADQTMTLSDVIPVTVHQRHQRQSPCLGRPMPSFVGQGQVAGPESIH